MAESIRELIFQNIKTTIEGITVANGYNYTLTDKVFIIHGKRDDAAYEEPLAYIYPTTERVNPDEGEKGSDYNELQIDIEMWVRSERSVMNQEINRSLADLKKALGADHTRGGYAIMTLFVSNDVILVDLTSEKCAILLTIEVHYQHRYGQPDVQGC